MAGLEVSSHALAQYRILGIPIEVAVYQHRQKHLNYHKIFKGMLVSICVFLNMLIAGEVA